MGSRPIRASVQCWVTSGAPSSCSVRSGLRDSISSTMSEMNAAIGTVAGNPRSTWVLPPMTDTRHSSGSATPEPPVDDSVTGSNTPYIAPVPGNSLNLSQRQPVCLTGIRSSRQFWGPTRMTGNRQAQRAFDAGVLALGIAIEGQESVRDLDYAKLAFTRATEWYPQMCDAWLGRAAAGGVTRAVLFELHKTSKHTLFRGQRRLGLAPRVLAGRFVVGQYIDYPLASYTEIWLAQASQLIADGEYDEAERLLDELAEHRKSQLSQSDRGVDDRICAYVRGVLHYQTQRWSDVMTVLAGSAGWDDPCLAAGAHVMVGTACAQLGRFGEAIRRMEQAEAGPIPAAATTARFCRGLCLRETGHEDQAKALFEKVFSEAPDFEANTRAMRDTKYRLTVTTREQIEARTDRWDPSSAPSTDQLGQKERDDKAKQILQ